MNVAGVGESITDVTDKNEFVEIRETEPVDKAGWIVRRISELGGYENVSDSVKADVFGFDIYLVFNYTSILNLILGREITFLCPYSTSYLPPYLYQHLC